MAVYSTTKGLPDTRLNDLDVITCGGTIRRLPGETWQLINEAIPEVSGHLPYGFADVVEQTDGTVWVYFIELAANMGTFLAIPDEGYNDSRLQVGASVGGEFAVLSFTAPFECRIYGTSVVLGAYLNSCTVEVDAPNGKITINHTAFVHSDTSGPPISICQYDKVAGSSEYIGLASTKTKTIIGSFNEIGGTITCVLGSISVAHALVVAPTVVWDATANQFIITHAIAQSVYDYGVTPCGFSYRPVVEVAGQTTLKVAMADAVTGIKYIGATPPDCKFNFRRSGRAACPWPITTRIQVSRGRLRVPCQDVQGAGSNIWLSATYVVASGEIE